MKTNLIASFVIVLALLLFGLLPHRALAWSALGHKTVADLGFEMLSNNVRSQVTAILGEADMRNASVWPDWLRDSLKPNSDFHTNQEMRQFHAAHPTHTDWHFVNLPLKTTTYDPAGPFARPDDIVHTINRCIDVLEGQSTVMSKRHALRWLVHLVGDLHQPLHVGCGYYRFGDGEVKLLKKPADAIGHDHDRGGNQLHYTKSQNLHSFWDDDLVNRIDGSAGDAKLLEILRKEIKPTSWKTSGAIRDWPAKWAVDSVKEAHSAYWGIQFGEVDLYSNGHLDSITIIRPKKYGDKQESRAARQLAKGGFHLAEILNKIQWQ